MRKGEASIASTLTINGKKVGEGKEGKRAAAKIAYNS